MGAKIENKIILYVQKLGTPHISSPGPLAKGNHPHLQFVRLLTISQVNLMSNNQNQRVMKKYLVIKHDNGSWISIDAQFDSKEQAEQYANIAAIGKPGYDFTVYSYFSNSRKD